MRRRTGCLIAVAVAIVAAVLVLLGANPVVDGASDTGSAAFPMPSPSVQLAPHTTLGPPPESAAAPAFCAAIEEPATPEDCARYEALRGQLADGAAAFNAPTTIKRGTTVRVRLAIDRDSAS